MPLLGTPPQKRDWGAEFNKGKISDQSPNDALPLV